MSQGTAAVRPVTLFYSYAHEDETFRKKLETHLSQLERQGYIKGWHDREITGGQEWGKEIDQHLISADVVLLLISADFIASRYCYEVEMECAMRRHEEGVARVIPIMLRPVDWEGAGFGRLQILPTDAKPISTWSNEDEAFMEVARGIRRVIEQLRQKQQMPADAIPETGHTQPAIQQEPGAAKGSATQAVFQFDVFVSYAPADRQWVHDALIPRLQDAGLRVAFESRNFRIGVSVAENVKQMVAESRYIAAVLTPTWIESEWPKYRDLLVGNDRLNSSVMKRLLPLIRVSCDPPARIAYLTAADFRDESRFTEQFQRLLDTIKQPDALRDPFAGKAAEYTRTALHALLEMMKHPAVIAVVKNFSESFRRTEDKLEVLASYKRLHDMLHHIEISCYRLILREMRRFPDDDVARENLEDHQQTLAKTIRDIRQSPPSDGIPESDVKWIELLEKANSGLEKALAQSDLAQLKSCKALIGHVLQTQTSHINTRLSDTARHLELRGLTDAMASIRDSVSGLGLDDEKIHQFEYGVEAMEGLDHALRELVDEHDLWQAKDNDLRLIEVDLEDNIDALYALRDELQKAVDALTAGKRDQWAIDFRVQSIRLQGALDDNNPVEIRSSFRRYRSEAVSRFYNVDVSLMNLCDRLREIGGELKLILDLLT